MGSLTTVLTLITFTVLFTVIHSQNSRQRRRMYAMCPPKFQRIGYECYAISDQPANWLEAHFQCKDKNSKLAEPNAKSDRKLRTFLQRMDHDKDEIWIGATFDWNVNTWQWSISGKNLTYDAFSRLDPKSSQNLEYHCAVFNPSLQYRWSARSCIDKHRYICQHKMPKVNAKGRIKVYDRWNQTYPNQLANEVVLDIIDMPKRNGKGTNHKLKPIDSEENYAMPPRRPTNQFKRHHQSQTRLPPKEISSNDINFDTNEINNFKYFNENNPQAAQPYMETTTATTKRPPNFTNAPIGNNDAKIRPTKPVVKFDKQIKEKRQRERQNKRRMHRMEVERKRKEKERKKQEDERKRLDDERKKQEEEKKRQEQDAIEKLKLKKAEEDAAFRQQENAAFIERQKLWEQLENSKKDQERQEAEEKIMKEKREEEEERMEKQRLHEQKRLQLEFEEKLKQQQTENERKLEEEKRAAEENRLRAEREEAIRQKELKDLEKENEKRLELERIDMERERQKAELERLEKENLKRIAAQKAREEELKRREEEYAKTLAEEKRLEQELKEQEERDRIQREQEIQREDNERKLKEEADRLEQERKEEERRKKLEKNKERVRIENEKLEKQRKEAEHKEKLRKYAERISKLSPELQRKFMEARRMRRKNKTSDNDTSVSE